MKLLFDHQLSPQLVLRLSDLFPGSSHVASEGLDTADDDAIWAFAESHGFAIVTKDADFNDLSVMRGPPPKVIWIRLGNCTTHDVEAAIRRDHAGIVAFNADPDAGVFEVS